MTALFSALAGTLTGIVLARFLLKTDEQHQGLQVSFFTTSLVKFPRFTFWGYQVLMAVLLAGLFAFNVQVFAPGWGMLFWQVTTALLVACAAYDLAFRLIPASLLVLLILVAALSPLVFGFPLLFLDALLGGVIVGSLVLVMYLVTAGQGIGEADVLMAVVIGMLFGWMKGLLVFSAANFLGLAVVLPLILVLGKKRMKHIPLLFFLSIAIFLEWYFQYTAVVLGWMGV